MKLAPSDGSQTAKLGREILFLSDVYLYFSIPLYVASYSAVLHNDDNNWKHRSNNSVLTNLLIYLAYLNILVIIIAIFKLFVKKFVQVIYVKKKEFDNFYFDYIILIMYRL